MTCGVVKGLFEIETKRSFPEVGEEASMGSCGGRKWVRVRVRVRVGVRVPRTRVH